MCAKKVSSDRRRSRPVTKHGPTYKLKRNKPALLLSILIVFMLVFSGFYVVFTSLTGSDDSNNAGANTNNGGNDTNKTTYDTEYPVAVFDTTMGEFAVELYNDKVPITTGNFINLSKSGFYDGVKFHRVIRDFMIQSGDPNSKDNDPSDDGMGGPGYTIPDEFHEDLSNIRGTISMANSGADTNSGGSQFFINVVDNTYLDFDTDPRYKHAVFGKVISGMDVVDDISNVNTDSNDRPIENVVINTIKIVNE